MKIKKIIVQNEGLKGLKIIYEKMEDKGGRTFSTDVIEEKRYPIHLGLETAFKKLREYYADICGLLAGKLDENQIKYIINDIDIIGLKISNDFFLISGKVNTAFDKKIAISTPKVAEEDEYQDYDKVQKIIEEILVETRDYMSGAKKATDEEFGRKVIEQAIKKGKETISLDEFESKSEEEKKIFCTQWLEKNVGSLISHPEDLEIPEEDGQVIELHAKVG